jgi:hypothetical protein
VRLYQPGQAVVICYEYVARLNELAEKIPADGRTLRGVSRDDAVTGAFIQAVLQQTSTAVFDLLELPVWGREHDAADKLAGFLMMQFGTATARKLLNGAAYFFEASDKTWTGCDFSDVRGTESQRFYNYLCVAYGGDPKNFSDFVEGQVSRNSSQRTDILPQSRADRCRQEFSVLEWSFQSLIMPNVDPAVMQQVLDRDWLKPIADQ